MNIYEYIQCIFMKFHIMKYNNNNSMIIIVNLRFFFEFVNKVLLR